MVDEKKSHKIEIKESDESAAAGAEAGTAGNDDQAQAEYAKLRTALEESNDKYLRLYAEFENYKKKVRKEKEEFLTYCNEDLLYELLPVIDNLDMALKHASEGNADSLTSLKQGVENTLRELVRTLDKFGLKTIESEGRPFDPAYHHAMSQVERPDVDDKTVLQEMRKGYLYKEKVLRPSLVAVSKKKADENQTIGK
ncbi:MAG TPA: nucleotide exchange factor GrpE [Dissulfurispiraceae bacterium]|nr:nucleotide exchange factor GrpE [Dissulfurispiraceae bacterium]